MLLWLAEYFSEFYSGFNVFRYLTLRVILAVLTSLLIAFLVGPFFIQKLKEKKIVQHVRHEGPDTHKKKSGTPTMGGLLIIASISFSTICWSNLGNRFVWIALFVTLMFSVIGWLDDHRKIVRRSSKGLSARNKYLLQSIVSIGAALFLFYSATTPSETQLIVPFIKSIVIDLGWLYVVLAYFVIIGSSNAVNLTDGLDGLAIVPTIMVAGALAVFAYVAGHVYFSDYLGLPYVPGAGEIAVFCGTIVGSGLGFLWFNTHPAQVFMGDIGALSLGAALGIIALIIRQELVLFIMGGIFVIETISVILQLGSYRLMGKRIFRMSPLHHHYEKKGWKEPQVVVRFWIITVILVLIGLASLKIR